MNFSLRPSENGEWEGTGFSNVGNSSLKDGNVMCTEERESK